jgi:predicted SnoaL-like aldol condensation-catalyzing enzyme
MSTPAHFLSPSEENKQLMIRWFDEVWNQSRREAIYEMYAPTAVLHDTAQDYRGPDAFAVFYDQLHAQFSGFSIQPVMTVAEGDLTAMHWSVDCTETATGKRIHLTGMSIARCGNGQILEAWQIWDRAGLAAQLAS